MTLQIWYISITSCAVHVTMGNIKKIRQNMMRKQCKRIMITSAATQVWCVDCVWPLVTSRPEPQCPVSRVTCDTVWRVTVTSHCVSQARVTRPQWWDDQVTYHWYSLTHHQPILIILGPALVFLMPGLGCLDMDKCRLSKNDWSCTGWGSSSGCHL